MELMWHATDETRTVCGFGHFCVGCACPPPDSPTHSLICLLFRVCSLMCMLCM
jgi:hypothetical protein